jgi:Flp pilus assembly protein TadD
MNAGIEHVQSRSKGLVERTLFFVGVGALTLSLIAGFVDGFAMSDGPPFGSLSYHRIARKHVTAGDYVAAAAEFRGEQRINPMTIRSSVELAAALRLLGDTKGSLEALRVGANGSLDPIIHVKYARALARGGQLARADAAVARALAIDPENPVTYLAAGKFHTRRGRLSAAVASYERALVIDPSMTEARHLLTETRERIAMNDGRGPQVDEGHAE